MNLSNISIRQLERAITLKQQISKLELELAELIGTTPTATPTPTAPVKRKRKLSAAGRARIVAAQKARSAKLKGARAK